jgi:cytochrome o ubiquinol oxidase subunit 2
VLLFVLAPVALLLPAFAWYYRISNRRATYRPQWGFNWLLEFLIWVPPTGIVVLLSFFLISYTTRLDPYRQIKAPSGEPPLEVDVVALDWKWLFIYPAQQVATVNQLVVPAGKNIRFLLTSGTVMQSLMMPQLAGQIYAMAGMRTELNFVVNSPGTYWGENTQYNGDGFHQEKFELHAVPPAGFAKWLAQTKANPAVFDAKAYQALSVQSVVKAPLSFGKVSPDLFEEVLAQAIPPGYLTQHHEGPNG